MKTGTLEVWTVGTEKNKVFVEAPFHDPTDARLYIDGNFKDLKHKKKYAEDIIKALNQH